MPEEQQGREARRQPAPVGRPNDDETDRTDLDMDEPGEGFGAGPWAGRDVTREEALRLLGGEPERRPNDDPTAPPSEGEGGTEEVR